MLQDYQEGPEWSHDGHLREFASLVMGHSGEELEATVNGLRASNYSIHFHVWSESSLREFLDRMIIDMGFPMKIAAVVDNTPTGGEAYLCNPQDRVMSFALRPQNWIVFGWSFPAVIPGWEERRAMKASRFSGAQRRLFSSRAPMACMWRIAEQKGRRCPSFAR